MPTIGTTSAGGVVQRLCGRAFRDQPHLARENATPEDDRGIRATEKFAVAVLDAPLAGLHGDVLHDGKIGMAHVGVP